MKNGLPSNLIEAVRYFSDENVCVEFVANLRWPEGPVCPRCESTEYSFLTTRRLWKCKACKKQYSVKVGTIFEDSAIKLDKWLAAIWLIANSKNGISSYELGRSLGITQKSAWFVNHRIRLAMQTGTFEKFDGPVEVDETYIGGKASNMHAVDRKRRKTRGGTNGKTAIVGTLQRDGRVTAEVIPDTTAKTLRTHIDAAVKEGATVYTDAYMPYRRLRDNYDHSHVDHSIQEYVNGNVHTNGIENFWSLLKRGLDGTYVSVQPFHLFRYLDERMFTYNERHQDDQGRFLTVLELVAGRRLTYAELTCEG